MWFKAMKHLLVLGLLIWQNSVLAAINGLWVDNQNHYWVLMQSAENQVIGAQIDIEFVSKTIYLGSISDQAVSLQAFSGDETINASLNEAETHLSGTISSAGTEESLEADLLFAYAGSEYDGVWQTDLDH